MCSLAFDIHIAKHKYQSWYVVFMLGAICGSAQSMDCADPQIAPNIYIMDPVFKLMLKKIGKEEHL